MANMEPRIVTSSLLLFVPCALPGEAACLWPWPRVPRAFQPQDSTWPSESMASVFRLPATCKPWPRPQYSSSPSFPSCSRVAALP